MILLKLQSSPEIMAKVSQDFSERVEMSIYKALPGAAPQSISGSTGTGRLVLLWEISLGFFRLRKVIQHFGEPVEFATSEFSLAVAKWNFFSAYWRCLPWRFRYSWGLGLASFSWLSEPAEGKKFENFLGSVLLRRKNVGRHKVHRMLRRGMQWYDVSVISQPSICLGCRHSSQVTRFTFH